MSLNFSGLRDRQRLFIAMATLASTSLKDFLKSGETNFEAFARDVVYHSEARTRVQKELKPFTMAPLKTMARFLWWLKTGKHEGLLVWDLPDKEVIFELLRKYPCRSMEQYHELLPWTTLGTCGSLILCTPYAEYMAYLGSWQEPAPADNYLDELVSAVKPMFEAYSSPSNDATKRLYSTKPEGTIMPLQQFTLLYGTDIKKQTETDLINAIKKMEAEVLTLGEVKVQSTKITAKIDSLCTAIEFVAKELDGRK